MDGSDGQRGAEADGPGRVCILAVERPYVHRQGSSTYLDHLARSLACGRRRGAPAHPAAAAARPAAPPPRAGLPRALRQRRALRRGAPRRGVLRPRPPELAGAAPAAPRRRRPAPGRCSGPSRRPRPGRRPRSTRLAPDWVIANYVNAAEVFDRLPAAVAKAILLHDVFALRAETLTALGRAARLRRGPDRPRGAWPSAPPTWCWRSSPRRRRTSPPGRPGSRSPPCPSRSTSPRPTSTPRGRRSRSSSARLNRPNVDALAWLLDRDLAAGAARPARGAAPGGRPGRRELRRPLARGGRAGRLRRGPRPRVRRRERGAGADPLRLGRQDQARRGAGARPARRRHPGRRRGPRPACRPRR